MFPEPLYRHGVYRTTKMWREQAERYRLVGSHCKSCGQLWWPKRSGVCGKCNSRDLEDHEFKKEGVVTACFIESEQSPFEPLQGYEVYGDSRIMAIIKLEEGVYVGPTEIVDCPLGEAKEGLRVKMVTRKLRRESNGNWMYGYMWVAAKD
jgi:uncharacterized OB-fold protein